MMGLHGLVARATRHAMKTSYKDTKKGFRSGSKHHRSSEPVTEAQRAFYRKLKRLAPKPRRKRLRKGPF